MTEKWGVRDGMEEWEVCVQGERIVMTHCSGPFGLPTVQMSFEPGSVGSVAKALLSAQKSVKRRKVTVGDERGKA